MEILDVAHMDLHSCISCFQGKDVGHCVVRDDMRRVEQALTRGGGSPETICASPYAAQAYQIGKSIG